MPVQKAKRNCAQCGRQYKPKMSTQKSCGKIECKKAQKSATSAADWKRRALGLKGVNAEGFRVDANDQRGWTHSGYRESAPRISKAPPLLSCPHCRSYNFHSDFCPTKEQQRA